VAVPVSRHRSVPRLRLVPTELAGARADGISEVPASERPDADEPTSNLRASPEPTTPPVPGSSAQRLPTELEDGQLVALMKVGDRAAYETLYRRHAPYVLSLAVRIQGNVTDVEDIVHDAFLRVLGRLDELRNGDAFRGWLASVTVNLVKTRMRKRRFLGALGLASTEAVDLDALVSAEAGPDTRAELAEVYGTLGTLPIDQRLAWILRYVEGHKLEEVARITQCSLATTKRRITLAQTFLSAHRLSSREAPREEA